MVVGKTIQAVTALSRHSGPFRESAILGVGPWSPSPPAPLMRPSGAIQLPVFAWPCWRPAKRPGTDVQCLLTGEIDGALQPISGVRCTLHTGRTHQIRVHLSHRKYPLVADALYGGSPALGLTARRCMPRDWLWRTQFRGIHGLGSGHAS